jgi:methyltransferase (TIGR00027 family)
MLEGQPSRTALAAAESRATHQVVEGGRIFRDPLAVRLLGVDEATLAANAEATPERRGMRIFVAARARFAEDCLAAAVARGTGQCVILGAGLDSFAYRSPFGSALRVFEIDHPATQAWKRDRLAAAGIGVPPWLTFAPTDFETTTLRAALDAGGFDPARPAFFIWLGVVPYLTRAAIFGTLATIAGLPGGAHVVFDYGDPPETLAPEQRAALGAVAAQVAAAGEPWITHFEPHALRQELQACGFGMVEDLDLAALGLRYFPASAPAAGRRGGHVVHAVTPV